MNRIVKQERIDAKDFKMVRQLERDVLRRICKYLQAKRYWFSRLQNVGVWDAKANARRKNWYMRKGLPDIICFKEHSAGLFSGKRYTLIAIEAKSEKGKFRPEQKDFMRLWELSGNKYILARTLDDLIRSGL